MIQVFDYYENKKLTFNDMESLCETLNLNRKNVIKAISRETRVLKRYLVAYGKLDEQLIIDKTPSIYHITDLQTEETKSFRDFQELTKYANGILKSNNLARTYYRNMVRGYKSYGRFKITKTKHEQN